MEHDIEIELDTLNIKGDPTKLYEALAKAQADFTPVPKMSEGAITRERTFKYASYSTLIRCVRPALSRNGITIFQPLHSMGDKAVTTTILAGHGASIKSSFMFHADKNPQDFGKCHTYYRRYQLQAMLGIEGDKDADDLPDVNEERAQFTEPAKEKPASPPKALASAATKSASVQSTEQLPATQSEPSTSSSPVTSSQNGKGNGKTKAEAKPEEKPAADTTTTTKTLNDILTGAAKELQWGLDELRAFYAEHVDPKGFVKAASLTVDQKKALLDKMVKLKGVTPF